MCKTRQVLLKRHQNGSTIEFTSKNTRLNTFIMNIRVDTHHPLPILFNSLLFNKYLPIEKGRWIDLERNDRKCKLCYLNCIGDVVHYMFNCAYFNR